MRQYDFCIIFEVDALTIDDARKAIQKLQMPKDCGIREVKPENIRELIPLKRDQRLGDGEGS